MVKHWVKVLPAVHWKVKDIPNFREEIENKLLLWYNWFLLAAFDKILQERYMFGEESVSL